MYIGCKDNCFKYYWYRINVNYITNKENDKHKLDSTIFWFIKLKINGKNTKTQI